MMKKLVVFSLFGLLLIGVPSFVHALDISVTDSALQNIFLSEGESYTGQFDINALFQGDPLYNPSYDISGASVSFNFVDDGESIETSNYITSSYSTYLSYRNWVGGISTYYSRTGIKSYFDEYESVQVDVNGDITSGETSYFSSTTNARVYDGSSYLPSYNYNYYYTDYSLSSSGYSGTVVIDRDLTYASLLDLSFDGILTYTVTAVSGDIYFQKSQLSAQINENPAPVPEPATILLLGSGFIVVFCMTRRQKNR